MIRRRKDRRLFRCLLAIAAVSMPTTAVAQSAATTQQAAPSPNHGFTFRDVLRAIGQRHPSLDASRSRLRATEFDIVGAGLWTNPQLNAVYTRSIGYTTFDPIIGFLQVGVTQFVETAGVPIVRRRAAEAERDAARFDVDATLRQLVFDAQEAFVELAAAVERRACLLVAVGRLERAAGFVDARVQSGIAPNYDRTRVALALADARAELGDAESDGQSARSRLDAAVGPGASALEGAPSFDLFGQPSVPLLATLLGGLADSRTDIQALEARSRSAAADVEVARRSVFPGVAIYGGLAIGQGYGPNSERQVDVLVGVTLPLSVVDRGQGAIGAAQARAQAAREYRVATEYIAATQVTGAYRELERRRLTLSSYVGSADAQTRVLNEAEAAYREGHLNVQGLIDAYEAVRTAQIRGIELARDAKLAEVRLWRAVGRLPTASGTAPSVT